MGKNYICIFCNLKDNIIKGRKFESRLSGMLGQLGIGVLFFGFLLFDIVRK